MVSSIGWLLPSLSLIIYYPLLMKNHLILLLSIPFILSSCIQLWNNSNNEETIESEKYQHGIFQIPKDMKSEPPSKIQLTSWEIQEKQQAYGKALQNIQNSELQTLIDERNAIYYGKELWSEELRKLDTLFWTLQKTNSESGTTTDSQLQEISKKRKTLLETFRESQEYKDYIIWKQSQLSEINSKIQTIMEKSWIK